MFDKEKQFEIIEEKLNEIRIACNRMQIPFIWVAAIKDDGQSTEYKIAVDANDTPDLDVNKYLCNALIPGSMGIKLKDDKLKDIVKVLNGFKVVPDTAPPIKSGGFFHSALFPEKGNFNDCKPAAAELDKPIILTMTAARVLPRIEEDFE